MSWLVIESKRVNVKTGEERTFINVVPDFGPEHDASSCCWCSPEEVAGVFIHKVFH